MNKMWDKGWDKAVFFGGAGGWMEVQLKDTIGAWKQHTTPDHFSHDAANRPDINWKMKWQTTKLACGTEKQTEKQHQQQEQKRENKHDVVPGDVCVIHDTNEMHADECTLKPGSASHGAKENDDHSFFFFFGQHKLQILQLFVQTAVLLIEEFCSGNTE